MTTPNRANANGAISLLAISRAFVSGFGVAVVRFQDHQKAMEFAEAIRLSQKDQPKGEPRDVYLLSMSTSSHNVGDQARDLGQDQAEDVFVEAAWKGCEIKGPVSSPDMTVHVKFESDKESREFASAVQKATNQIEGFVERQAVVPVDDIEGAHLSGVRTVEITFANPESAIRFSHAIREAAQPQAPRDFYNIIINEENGGMNFASHRVLSTPPGVKPDEFAQAIAQYWGDVEVDQRGVKTDEGYAFDNGDRLVSVLMIMPLSRVTAEEILKLFPIHLYTSEDLSTLVGEARIEDEKLDLLEDVGYEIKEDDARPGLWQWVAPSDCGEKSFPNARAAAESAWIDAVSQTMGIGNMSSEDWDAKSFPLQKQCILDALKEDEQTEVHAANRP